MFKYTIFGFILLAFVIRVLFIFQGGISFHYDMARDAFEAQKIWRDGHFKILGPPTSVPGLYHGVIYYYLIAPFYQLGNGDPRIVAVFLSLINALAVIPVMLLAKDIFKSKQWAYLAGFLYVVSFEATQYAPWISNPSPAALTVPLFFLFLRAWQKGKNYGLYLAVLAAALSSQFQFFLVYLFLLIPIFGLIFKIKTSTKTIGISVLFAFFGLINFFIAAIKFKTSGNILGGFLNIGVSSSIDFRPQFVEIFFNLLNRYVELFTFNFFPTNVFIGSIIAFASLYAIRKNYILLFFLFSNIPILIFGGHSNTYANVGLALPAILAVLYFLLYIRKVSKKLIIVLIVLSLASNLTAIIKYNPQGQIILVIPNDMNLKNELNLIDETYALAGGKPFSVNSLTLPLWINTTWAYLYSWYGKEKYGYVPVFLGHNQVGLLGEESLPLAERPYDKTFFIIEPRIGIPEDRFGLEIGSENSRTELIKQFDYGEVKLQYRKPKTNE